MSYAIIVDDNVQSYPVNPFFAHPNTSFPADFAGGEVDGVTYARVQATDRPEIDAELQAVEEAAPVRVDGVWTQQWAVRDLTPDELAARRQTQRESMVISRFQGEAALYQAGLLDDVEALIADPATDPLVKIAWNRVTEFRRLSPMIAGIAQALGWTDEQLDQLFETAAGIEA